MNSNGRQVRQQPMLSVPDVVVRANLGLISPRPSKHMPWLSTAAVG